MLVLAVFILILSFGLFYLYRIGQRISSRLDIDIANSDIEIIEKEAAIARLDATNAELDMKISVRQAICYKRGI